MRKGLLTITSGSNLSETITVVQNLEEDRDDHMPVGHIYFNDDFAWCVGGTDDVGSQTIGDARNIYTWNYEANGFTSSLPTFQSLYEDLNSNAKTVYTMNGYIKFDKTNTITAIAIRNLGIAAEKSTNVKVSFRCARYNTDKTTVVVAIEGEGSIDGGSQAGTRIVSGSNVSRQTHLVRCQRQHPGHIFKDQNHHRRTDLCQGRHQQQRHIPLVYGRPQG